MAFPVFDLHCDTADRIAWQTLPRALRDKTGMAAYGPDDECHLPEVRDIQRNRCQLSIDAAGPTPWVQCLACFVPDELDPEEAVAFHRHVDALIERQAEEHPSFVLARAAAELPPDPAPGRLIGVKTIENARLFAADPALIPHLAEQGLAMASLSWNAPGPLASGHDDEERGVTPLGLTVLRLMEAAGVVLDVSHLNDRCFADVAAHAERPFVASHSNSRSICGHPRNLTDAQFAEIRDRGGLVGLNYCCDFVVEGATPSFDDISRHIDHWLSLDGAGVIALGSDFDGCDTPPCIATAREMPSFQEQLCARFGDTVTRALCYGNALSFFQRAWG